MINLPFECGILGRDAFSLSGRGEMTTDVSKEKVDIAALQAGEPQAFARFVDQYSTPVYRLALKMLGNPQDAEDVLQNTFLKVFENIRNFEGRASLSTWVYRIASNEALMLLRKRKHHPAVDTDFEQMDDSSESFHPHLFVDWCCLPEDTLLNAEMRVYLDKAIQKLPEKLRIVFVLRDIEGLSIKETSQVLDISESAVKTRLLRARMKLRETLSVYYRPYLDSRLL